MTVFEFQVDPDRNAIIRRALAKRIVRQREVEDEEASTEEDESFLENSPKLAVVSGAAARKASASRSATGSPTRKLQGHHHHHHSQHHPHHRHHHKHHEAAVSLGPGPGLMNAKSRWKKDYLRQASGSPSDAVSVADSTDTVPENHPQRNGGSKDVENSTVTVVTGTRQGDGTEAASVGAVAIGPLDTTTLTLAAGPDPVELEILSKLEELKKEKSRLFALFRETLQRKEPATSTTAPKPSSPTQQQQHEQQHQQHSETQQLSKASISISSLHPPSSRTHEHSSSSSLSSKHPLLSVEEGRKDRAYFNPSPSTFANSRHSRDDGSLDTRRQQHQQDHERISDQASRQPNGRRREYERTVDRSKLNLEIPRKPMSNTGSSASSSSTSSTPTTSFTLPTIPKIKRQRSISPPPPSAPAAMTEGNTKYPRADYMGPSSSSSSAGHHNRHASGSNTYSQHPNGLPDRPSNYRYPTGPASSSTSSPISPTALGPPTGPASNRNSGGRDSYYNSNESSESYHRFNGINKFKGPGRGPSPTRIGFGTGNGSHGGGPRGGSGGSNRGGFFAPDGPSAGRDGGGGGGYHNGPPSLGPMSGPGGPPPPGRGMPFNRSMMQMNHARGLMQPGRFGGGIGGGGGRGGGGPPDRPMTSGRPDDWSRRRSRA